MMSGEDGERNEGGWKALASGDNDGKENGGDAS
jgi:hypothetical protein